MKAEELKGKTVDELNKLLLDAKKRQFNLRFQVRQGVLENTSAVRQVRREVAKIKTVISQLKKGQTPETGAKKKTTKKAADTKAA